MYNENMQNTFFNLDWKILVGISFITVFLIAAFLFFSNYSSSPTPTPTPNLSPSPTQQIYDDPDYSISYPPDVAVTPASVAGGGKALIFNLPQGPDYTLELDIIPSNQTSNANIISNIFRDMKYQESDISIDNTPAKEFSGSTKVDNIIFQEKIALAENNGQFYKLHLIYKSDQRKIEADNLFFQILSTLKFK